MLLIEAFLRQYLDNDMINPSKIIANLVQLKFNVKTLLGVRKTKIRHEIGLIYIFFKL